MRVKRILTPAHVIACVVDSKYFVSVDAVVDKLNRTSLGIAKFCLVTIKSVAKNSTQ
jgi:hypothetical protein